jgi:predicted nucleic acid-binding protein
VIQMAVERSVRIVLIDERKGRRIARQVYGLQTIGTARVLVEAHRAGLVGDLAPFLETLKGKSYWIADSIVNWAVTETSPGSR